MSEFAPDAETKADPAPPGPAVMLADIDHLEPADMLAELPY